MGILYARAAWCPMGVHVHYIISRFCALSTRCETPLKLKESEMRTPVFIAINLTSDFALCSADGVFKEPPAVFEASDDYVEVKY
jgi:hypothetical protein